MASTFKSNAIWNILSFALVGASGLALILGIARFYSPAELGTFNLVYSFYILGSQLVGAGIHFSVLRSTSEHGASEQHCRTILSAALFSSIANSLVWIVLLAVALPVVIPLFTSADLAASIWYVFPALFFCGQNKVLLASLNGREHFRAFAILNAFRGIAFLLLLAASIVWELPGIQLPLILSGGELLLYLALLFYTKPALSWSGDVRSWCRTHFVFGYHSLLGSLFIDVNTRVDILILGLFWNDELVGIYSYAAILVDGFSQLPIVVRTLINPRITQLSLNSGSAELLAFLQRVRNLTYAALVPAGVVLLLIYQPIVTLLGLSEKFHAGFLPLCILLSGLLITIGYAPMLMIFNQLGKPKTQSLLYIVIFCSNLVLNLLLVPWFGMLGSALGTALSYVAFVFTLKALLRRKVVGFEGI